MRQLLFPAAAVALCGCAATTPAPHNAQEVGAPIPLTTNVEARQPTETSTGRCGTCRDHDLLLDLDLALANDALTDGTEADPDGVGDELRLHDEHPPFAGPLPVPPKPPIDAGPLEIAIWVGIASLNYDPTTPFNLDALEPFIAPPLATELHRTASRTAIDGELFGSRGVLLDAWLTEPPATDSLADGVAMFERTTEGNTVDIVFIDFLAHETEEGWQIIELLVSST